MAGRVAVLLLITGSTLFAAANVHAGWLYVLGSLFAGLLAASLAIAAWSLRKVTATVSVEGMVEQGGEVAFALKLENLGASSRSFLAAIAPPLGEAPPDRSRKPGGSTQPGGSTKAGGSRQDRSRQVDRFRAEVTRSLARETGPDSRWQPSDQWSVAVLERLPAQASAQLLLAVPAPRRGVFEAPVVYLQSTPLGLFRWRKQVRARGEVVVTPRIVAIESLTWLTPDGGTAAELVAETQVPSAEVAGGADRLATHAGGTVPQGDLIRSIREYRTGDPVRMVHWRRSARLGQLVVKETDGAAVSGGVTVALDLWGHTADSLEHAITVAASLLARLHADGLAVRLVSQAGGVEGELSDQLEALARVQAADHPLDLQVEGSADGGLVLVAPGDIDRRFAARYWIQAAPRGARPAVGAIFCPEGCDIAGVLRSARPEGEKMGGGRLEGDRMEGVRPDHRGWPEV